MALEQAACAVSVIIPVYNVQAFLPRCVASLQVQTCTDWEALLVDDGSTDGSGALCDAYAQQDARIRALHLPNGGQGSARNQGLAQARGEYIAFVDPDDTIRPEMLAENIALARREQADIVVFGYQKQFVDKDGNLLRAGECDLPQGAGTYTYTEFWAEFPKLKYRTMGCMRLFRRAYLQEHALQFPPLRVSEDAAFLTRVMNAPFAHIVYNPKVCYDYSIRPASSMTSFQRAYFEAEVIRQRGQFAEVVRRHEPTPGCYEGLITRELVCGALEAAKKLSFVRGTLPDAERLTWLCSYCESDVIGPALQKCTRRETDSAWQWVGAHLLQKKHYRLALCYFDALQGIRILRGRLLR